MPMENISNFLNAARQLGVQSSDLFQTVDLYEGKDMTQVVSTILTLERVVGGVARMVNKRPGPNPHVASESTPAPQTGGKGVLGVTRMRSKTAHTPSVASNTASIRPSSSSFYAAQVRKLEEDSIRFASGYDRLEATTFKPKDPRHQSTPVIGRATPPITKNRAVHLPSLNDNSVAAENTSFGSDEDDTTLVEALNRREQRDLVFGLGSSLTSEQSGSIPKSASGPILPIGSKSSALDMTRRKKKSISLDPQAANAVMGTPGYRNGLASPVSPGMLPQSVSHNAISNLSSPTTPRPSSQQTSIKHARYSSDRTIDGAISRSGVGSPVSSRSTTPVQGLRKSTNSFEPLRERLELIENEVPVSTYQLGNCIGRGQFGSVYKALNLVTGQMVAVKRIKIDGLKEEEREMLMQEVDLLKSLAHPSIVKYEGFIKTDSYLNIILEFAENGSLLTTLKIFGTFSEQLVVAYVVKILEGLVYLHGKEVVHCDLKAANILTTKNGNVKLSDFGVSLNLKVKEADFGAVAGTPNWMAPEVIELKGASPASDIWSLGCTIIELLTGVPPYADLLAMTTLFRIVEDERPPLPNNLSMDLLDFLCQCFQKDPALRPSARALGRHNWIKRNFTSKELKPMDSLPFLRRKFPEPRDKSLLTVAAEESKGNASRRALTPSGLTTGAPPPAASASATMQINGRSTRRGSVDSASAYYASYTVPAPTNIPDKFQEGYRGVGVGGIGEKEENQHRFVKSSFAKPVECRWCHRFAKKAVICQDCNMVFHREECPDAVGNTCFPGPHLSYFQSTSPAPSVPNLKTLNSGKSKGGSRPTSRASQINTDDRSRSVTPSQGLSSRPCRTPPPSTFMKRETTTINENREQRRVVSPQPPLPLAINHRAMSPEGYSVQTEQHNLSRPSSRQSESPTSPTFSGLRNIFSSPRRFSFAKKTTHPLPTSSSSASPLPSQNARQQAGTPDSGKVLRQPPVTPPKALPVPITGSKNSSAGKVYRGREQLPGPLDPFDENKDSSYNYSRSHQRPTVTSIFSSSAPPVNSEYLSGRRSVNSTTPGDDESHDDEKTESDEDEHKDIHDMDEEDIEALLIPSLIKSPRSSIDSGNQVVVTNGGGHHRVNSQSIGQALSQQTHGQDTQAGIANNKRYDSSSPVPRNNPTVTFDSPASVRSALHQQNPQQQQYLGRTLLNNGYNSSGSSSAAFTSSYSSQSNHGSSVSSIGSIAALLEEEERMMNENRPQENKSGSTGAVNGHSKNGMLGVSSAYQLANQTPQSHHVGIRTMLNRFSASGKDQNNPYNNSGTNDSHNGSVNAPEKEARHAAKVSAYTAAAAARHQIQAPTQYQNQLSQSHAGIRSIHPLEQQQYQPSSGSKSEFSPGYESQSHIQSHGSGSEYTNGSANGWRASSPSNINYSSMGNTAQPSLSMTDHIYNANNNNVNAAALKRGGKVIRRSMGVALEKERWD
ncbi:hypothetical protein BGZ49_003556 [Haplosporangium sp. Z 27]|nr:hypothetical protein BGZ49_003556 [Haplosporangium sp. Z 27]